MHLVFSTLLLVILSIAMAGCVDDSQSPDSVLEDHSIAYVKRALYDGDGNLIPFNGRELLTFRPGGDLYLRDRASPTAPEHNITHQFTQGEGDVRDLDVSFDGTKILFSMRAPELDGVPDDQQPTWNIWEFNTTNNQLNRIIGSNLSAEKGEDLAPSYLPDGRIVFSSTRQREAGRQLLDEGKPQFSAIEESRREHAAVLHVMDADGSNIQQISFNASHDYDPTVLMSGRILFSRWDNMGGQNAVRLYTIRPDGTDLQLHYGAHSDRVGHENNQTDYMQTRQMEDGKLLATQVLRNQNNRGGDLVIIDAENYIDNDQPIAVNQGVLTGSGQQVATQMGVRLDNRLLSGGGQFLSAYPLWDGSQRILVSWSPCRVTRDGRAWPCSASDLTNRDAVTADPLFALYLYDTNQHTMRPLVKPEEGVVISDVLTLRDRDLPTILYDGIPGDGRIDQDLYDAGNGLLHIRSVYDVDGVDIANPNIAAISDPQQTAAVDRRARFIKIIKSVAIPDRDTLDLDLSVLGRSTQQLMREVVGYAMVEPDGSVQVEVPANITFTIALLDADGRRVHNRHQMWMQLRPGESVECNGCHNHNSGIPHGRVDGVASIYAGASTSALPFPNTNPAMIANIEETMAQTRTRLSCESDCAARKLRVDIEFTDVWSNPALRTPDSSFDYRYADLDSTLAQPTGSDCQSSWQPLCRIIINYPDHIHPLWDLPRVDAMLNDNRCTRCHSDIDELGVLRVPEAQLQLNGGISPEDADHLISYRELLFTDNIIGLQEGALQDVLVQATNNAGELLFETDDDGELILDAEENPIPILVTQRAPGPSMSTASANSRYFLSLFENGGVHDGYLTSAEMRLISEWLDIGAQYYNNPFDVPQEE